jgi:hypothetical protein
LHDALSGIQDKCEKLEANIDDCDGMALNDSFKIDRLEKENDALIEHFHAHIDVEAGLATMDLHNEAVDRLEQARDSVVALLAGEGDEDNS